MTEELGGVGKRGHGYPQSLRTKWLKAQHEWCDYQESCFLNRRAGATVKGGGYFFVPGIKARHYLATLGG